MTLPVEEDAKAFCHNLLKARLAAGINILGPCDSIYHWDGEIHERREWILLAQVDKNLYEDFQQAVLHSHPYQIPCILSMGAEGYKPFLKWINNPDYVEK